MTAKIQEIKESVLKMSDRDFNDLALQIFELQYDLNRVYRDFVSNLSLDISKIDHWSKIPCLPISFFKRHEIILEGVEKKWKFHSSGTTGQIRSTKYLSELSFYEGLSKQIFEAEFGCLEDYHILALLPSYMDNQYSSLIYMINHFIKQSGAGAFYNNEFEKLIDDLNALKDSNKKIILWGVSFALLDLVEQYSPDLSNVLVFETGGMKGRKKEITREELHTIIRSKSGAQKIFSEYGMTEMMSQAYTFGNTKYKLPNSMRLMGMELNDPLTQELNGRIGALNIIDLGNVETCAFIATEDLGRVYEDGTFEVLGRKDNAELRGCNLMSA